MNPRKNLSVRVVDARSFPKALLIPLLFLFLLPACEKDELKKPTRVGVRFKIQKDDVKKDGNSGGQGNAPELSLDIATGVMHLESIRILGERKNGADVDFEREERSELPVMSGATDELTYFELPQGSYEELKVELKFGRKGGGKVFRCEGERRLDPPNGPLKATPFRLDIEEKKTIMVPAVSGQSLELNKGDPRTLEVEVEVGDWFRGIGVGEWQNAAIEKGPNGKDRIPIRKGKNAPIYQKVLKRIDNAFKARIL